MEGSVALSQIPGEQPVCVCDSGGEKMKATGLTVSVKKKAILLGCEISHSREKQNQAFN